MLRNCYKSLQLKEALILKTTYIYMLVKSGANSIYLVGLNLGRTHRPTIFVPVSRVDSNRGLGGTTCDDLHSYSVFWIVHTAHCTDAQIRRRGLSLGWLTL